MIAEDQAGNASVSSTEVPGTSLTDTTPPSTVQGVTTQSALGRVTVTWTATTDDVGVARYRVHRSPTPGFTPDASTLIATVTSGTSHTDLALAPGTYYYRVVAEDLAGNASSPSAEAAGSSLADTSPPTVSVSSPVAGATVSGTATVTAAAADDVAVAGVQFRLDGANLGAEDTSAPFSLAWDTTSAAPGPHTLSAVARDAAGNTTAAADVSVVVDNSIPAGPVPVAAYAFEEGSGATVADGTGKGHTGTIREATCRRRVAMAGRCSSMGSTTG